MPKFQNLVGLKFNKLLVLEHAGKNPIGKHQYLCKCDCGNTTIARSEDIKSGNTKSCGCIRSEQLSQRNFKHGFAHTDMYNVWSTMKERCYNENSKAYKNYGGRGIKLSLEWQDYTNFHNDMVLTYKKGLSIERVDNNKNYSKENCIWAGSIAQANNTKRNRIVELNGEKDTLVRMCKKYNVDYIVMQSRLYKGWSVKEAFEKPYIKK